MNKHFLLNIATLITIQLRSLFACRRNNLVTIYKAAQVQGDNKQSKSIKDQAKTRVEWRTVMKFQYVQR